MEIGFTVSYILKENTEEVANFYLYYEFLQIEKYINVKAYNLSEKEKKEWRDWLEKAKDQMPDGRDKYLNKSLNPFCTNRIIDMADKANMKKRYKLWYSYLSEIPHSTSASLSSYTMRYDENESLKVITGRSYKRIAEALDFGCKLYLEILKQWCNHLNISKEKEIKILEERVNKIFGGGILR